MFLIRRWPCCSSSRERQSPLVRYTRTHHGPSVPPLMWTGPSLLFRFSLGAVAVPWIGILDVSRNGLEVTALNHFFQSDRNVADVDAGGVLAKEFRQSP